MLALAIGFGAQVDYTASLAWTLPLAAIAVLTAVSLGFAIAGWAPTPESANHEDAPAAMAQALADFLA